MHLKPRIPLARGLLRIDHYLKSRKSDETVLDSTCGVSYEITIEQAGPCLRSSVTGPTAPQIDSILSLHDRPVCICKT